MITWLVAVQSKRGDRDGNDTESGDEQAGSPLHVLSDVAQKECHLEARPEAAAVIAARNMAYSRMQTRHGGSAAAAAASGTGERVMLAPLRCGKLMSHQGL